MIPKPGQNCRFPLNYRPLSLLAAMGKICEMVILQRLNEVVEERKIIPDIQFGFRAYHSTVHQVLRVVERASEGFNRRQSTGAIFQAAADDLEE